MKQIEKVVVIVVLFSLIAITVVGCGKKAVAEEPSPTVTEAVATPSGPEYDTSKVRPYKEAGEGQYIRVTITDGREGVSKVNLRGTPWKGDEGVIDTIQVGTTFVVEATYLYGDFDKYVGLKSADVSRAIGRSLPGEYVWIMWAYLKTDRLTYPWAVSSGDFGSTIYHQGPSTITVQHSNLRSEPFTGTDENIYCDLVQTVFNSEVVYVSYDQKFFGFPVESFYGRLCYVDVNQDSDGIVWIYEENCVIHFD